MSWLVMGAACLGALIFFRALDNLRRMNRTSNHGIRALNTIMILGGAALSLGPLVPPASVSQYLLNASLALLAAFVVCMFIGRRPGDKVLSEEPRV